MKTIQEIKDAVDQGIVVYWKNPAYKVYQEPWGEYCIICTLNKHVVGLNDDFDPADFFTFLKNNGVRHETH